MNCILTKEFLWTKGEFDEWEEHRTKEYDEFRMMLHQRTMNVLNKVPITKDQQKTYEFCDHHYHWRYYGLLDRTGIDGKVQHSNKSYTDSIFGLCPDWVAKNEEKARKSSFKATIGSVWDKLKIAPSDKEAFIKARGFYKSSNKTLIISGSCGYGKTELAKAVQYDFDNNGETSYFVTCERLVRNYLEAHPTQNEIDVDARQAILDMRNSNVTVIDDLGTAEREYSESFKEQFKMFLDEHHGRLIITTNLTRIDLENKFNDKIISRIFDKKCVEINLCGKDYRRF